MKKVLGLIVGLGAGILYAAQAYAQIDGTTVPEPATLGMFAIGVAGFVYPISRKAEPLPDSAFETALSLRVPREVRLFQISSGMPPDQPGPIRRGTLWWVRAWW